MTDMTFANGSQYALLVKIFLNNDNDNTFGVTEQFSFTLPAGQSRTIQDVVQYIGLSEGSYVLRTAVACPSPDVPCGIELFNVTARTYSQGYGGWFGVSLPNLPFGGGIRTLAFQDVGNSRKALYVFGVPRSVQFYDNNGGSAGSVPLSTFTADRLTRVPLGNTVSYVVIDVDQSAVCYGTQVDNVTQSQIVVY